MPDVECCHPVDPSKYPFEEPAGASTPPTQLVVGSPSHSRQHASHGIIVIKFIITIFVLMLLSLFFVLMLLKLLLQLLLLLYVLVLFRMVGIRWFSGCIRA